MTRHTRASRGPSPTDEPAVNLVLVRRPGRLSFIVVELHSSLGYRRTLLPSARPSNIGTSVATATVGLSLMA